MFFYIIIIIYFIVALICLIILESITVPAPLVLTLTHPPALTQTHRPLHQQRQQPPPPPPPPQRQPLACGDAATRRILAARRAVRLTGGPRGARHHLLASAVGLVAHVVDFVFVVVLLLVHFTDDTGRAGYYFSRGNDLRTYCYSEY